MNQTNKNYARTLNKRLKGWDDAGIESDLVRQTRALLEMFYDKYGFEADANYFATDLYLTPQAEEEYSAIMDQFGNKAGSSINEMRRSYEEKKEEYAERFDVNSFPEYVAFTDKMKQALLAKQLKEIISSEQIAELYSVASSKNIPFDEVDRMLIFEYQSSGKVFDALYEQILGAIESYDATLEFGWD